LGDPDVDGRIILRCGVMDLIELTQNRHRWRALVNAVKNIQVPENVGSFLTRFELVSFSRRIVFHGVGKQ
jgi:hypothetical protein